MIKFDLKSPVGLGISSTAAMSAWASSGFLTDPKHVVLALSAGLAGSAAPSFQSSQPNVSADSHIVTPYANNVEHVKE